MPTSTDYDANGYCVVAVPCGNFPSVCTPPWSTQLLVEEVLSFTIGRHAVGADFGDREAGGGRPEVFVM